MVDEKVSLAFVLDEAAQKRVESRVSTLAEEMAKLGVTMDQIRGAKFGDQVASEVDKATKATRDRLNPALKQTRDAIKEARAEAALLQKQAAAMSSDLENARIAALRTAAGTVGGIGRGALLTGGAITGGIFLAAKNYIKDAEQSDRLTQKWLASTEQIERAQQRIGRVAARTVLPLLEQAANVAEKVASFTEANPEIVQAALNVGLLTAGFGALATAVSQGIKLVADVKYLATIPTQLEAARLQDQAANKQLEAAQNRLEELGVPGPDGKPSLPAGTGISSKLATVALYATSVLVSAELGAALGNKIGEAITKGKTGLAGPGPFNVQDAVVGTAMLAQTPGFLALQGLNKLGVVSDQTVEKFRATQTEIDRFAASLLGANKILSVIENLDAQKIKKNAEGGSGTIGVASVASLGSDLATSSNRDQVVAAWENWQEEDARIVQDAADRRVQIVRDAESRIASATAQFASRVTSINTAADRRAADLTANFLQANADAEAQYQEQRAEAIEDGNQAIQDIQEAHQERLRQMERDHNERVEDLTSSRDALGLAKEQRRFNQERAEENRSTRLEIAKRRADLAERLADLARQNESERAQRLAQYQQALADNEAQRKEQLKEAAAAFAEEQRQIREQRAQQLRELQEGLNAERLRRREVFIEQIRDLDVSLLGERNLRVQRYNEMLTDVDRFLADYRARLAAIGTVAPPSTPGFALGGYASGLVRTGEMGMEYIMTNRTTRAAEKIIGGRLTQDALLGALARGGSTRRSLTIHDHSRFDGRISSAQVRAIKQETIGEIARELG